MIMMICADLKNHKNLCSLTDRQKAVKTGNIDPFRNRYFFISGELKTFGVGQQN